MLRFLLLAWVCGLAQPLAAPPPSPALLASVPFDIVGGVLVLRNLPFNGQRGDFILDTGCTYALLVDQGAFPSQLRPSTLPGLSAAGPTALYELPVTQFELGQVRPPTVAQATSLASLRPVVGPQLLGLIGTGLLKRYEVVLDYAHRRLSLYALGPQQSAARPFTRRDSLAFTLEKGWPIAQAVIGAAPVRLLLDTGARDSHLDADFAQALPPGARPMGAQRETILTPGGAVAAQRALLPRLRVGSSTWAGVPVVVAPAVRYQSGRKLPYKGVLGGSFLSQEPLVSLHFGRHQLYTLQPKRP